MERHIGEASRSATALEKVAQKIDEGNRAVMRAYVTVAIGGATFQERREGEGDFKFEARPNFINAGNTPARNVCIRIAADILPAPIPDNFTYPLGDNVGHATNAGLIGGHQATSVSAVVPNFVADADVADIKEGRGKGLYVWGIVTYDDIFGVGHKTEFAQWLLWFPNGNVFGYYIPGHNDAD